MTPAQVAKFQYAIRSALIHSGINESLNRQDGEIANIMIAVLRAIQRKSPDAEQDYKENREQSEQGTLDCFTPLLKAYSVAWEAGKYELAIRTFKQGATPIMSLLAAIANLEAIEDTMKAFAQMSTHDAVQELERRKQDLENVLAFYGSITELWNEENT